MDAYFSVFEGHECLVIPATWMWIFLPLQKFVYILGCINTVDNIFLIIYPYSEGLVILEANNISTYMYVSEKA